MPKLTHSKRTVMTSLVMTGVVAGAVQTVSADTNNLDDLNQRLQTLSKDAERIGLKIVIKDTKVHDTDVSALTDVKQETSRIQKAIAQVESVNKTITSLASNLEKQGVKFDGVKTIEIDATNVDDINQKLKDLETQFKSIAEKKSSTDKNLQDAIKSARDAGVEVEEKGAVDVPANQLEETVNQMIKELQDTEKSQKDGQVAYQKALDDWEKTVTDGKAKVESDYATAVAAWDKGVADGHAKVEKEYQDALATWEAQVADGKAKIEQEYQDALKSWESKVAEGKAQVDAKNSQALKAWEAQVADGKAKVEKEYQDALAKWNAAVEASKAKVEADYQTALKAYNAEVDKVNKQNEEIRKQNEATKEAFKNAVAKLSTKSTATKVGDNYQQTIKQTVTKGATVEITVSSKIGTEIIDVELVGPNGFKQKLNKPGTKLGSDTSNNVYHNTNDLAPGEYTLTYTFKPGANKASDITSKFEVTTPDKVGAGSGSATFTTKAPIVTATENTVAPLTVAHVFDYSSSYAGKLKDSLRLSKKIIEANSPESKHIFLTYAQNYDTTYAANMADTVGVNGFGSKLLSKDQALSLIDKLLKINAPSEKDPTYTSYPAYFQGVADTFGELRYKDASVTPDRFGQAMKPYENIIEDLTKPTDTISVIQYTDGWMLSYRPDGEPTETSEEIDKTFADWAKKRAKTFMSVINRNQVTNEDTNSLRSIQQMEAVGHPNIYDLTGKDKDKAEQEIIKQFLETATEKVTSKKGENQTAKITLGGDGVTVTKAVLKGDSINKPLTITNGKVDVSEKLPDGNYTVEFEATGNGTLKYQIAVDGKNVVDKTAAVSGAQKGSVKTETRVDNFEPVEQGKLIPELPVPQNKPVKGEYKEPPKPVKGEYKEPEKPKPDVYVAPEKPVKGEYKEPPKPVKGEYKEPPKPVKGEYKEPEKPKAPENKRVELKKIQVVTEKPELKVKDIETHKVSVKPKELPKTGDASGIASLFGLSSVGAGLSTLIGKRRKRK